MEKWKNENTENPQTWKKFKNLLVKDVKINQIK